MSSSAAAAQRRADTRGGKMRSSHRQAMNRSELSPAARPQGVGCNAVTDIVFRDDTFVLHLADGCLLSVPLQWYPRLREASAEARTHWVVTSDGCRIHWPDLDQEFSVRALLRGE